MAKPNIEIFDSLEKARLSPPKPNTMRVVIFDRPGNYPIVDPSIRLFLTKEELEQYKSWISK